MSEVWSVPGYEVLSPVAGVPGDVRHGRDSETGELVDLERLADPGRVDVDVLRRQTAWVPALGTPYLRRLRAVVETGTEVVLVLDPAPGGSLAALLRRRRALAAGEVVTVAAPLAQALAAVHGLGLVHGRVSSSTVLFTADGMPVLDLAAAAADDDDAQAGAGGAPSDDVRALAALCHAMLAGVPPQPRAGLPLLAPGAPRALVHAVELGLSDDAAQRPDAAAFAALLRRAHAPAPVRLVAADPAPALPAPPARTSRGRHAASPPPRVPGGRRPSSGVAAAAAVAALLVLGGLVGWRSGQEPPASAPEVRAPDVAPVLRPAAASPSPSVVPPGVASVLPSPAAASSATADWRRVVDGLDFARAVAFREADAAALDAVWAPGTAGLAADRRRVQALDAAGQRAHGVRHVIRSVDLLSASTERVRLRVVDALAAAEVRDAGGVAVRRAPARGETSFEVELVRTSGGWRLADVSAPDPHRARG